LGLLKKIKLYRQMLTIIEFVNNRVAHQNAGYWNGKIQYKGKGYTYDEFSKAFPINAEKLISESDLINSKYKGLNPDKTKVV
jgi:hypothetical protein